MIILGYITETGHLIVSDAGDIANRLQLDLGGTWSNIRIENGYIATSFPPTSWGVSPYLLRAKRNDGESVCYELQRTEDDDLYRGVSSTGKQMGSGNTQGCAGCSSCIEEFDENLKTTGCSCLGEGKCSLSGGPLA